MARKKRNMTEGEKAQKMVNKATRRIILDAIHRRATVLPPGKAYSRKRKHAKKGDN